MPLWFQNLYACCIGYYSIPCLKVFAQTRIPTNSFKHIILIPMLMSVKYFIWRMIANSTHGVMRNLAVLVNLVLLINVIIPYNLMQRTLELLTLLLLMLFLVWLNNEDLLLWSISLKLLQCSLPTSLHSSFLNNIAVPCLLNLTKTKNVTKNS